MKIEKRKLLGPFFKPLARVRHSKTTRIGIALFMLPGQIIRAGLNRPYFSVDLKGGRGMGALLRDAIQVCNYAEQNKLVVQVESTNPLYSSKQNGDVIQTYFGPETKERLPKLHPLRFLNKWDFLHLKFPQHIPLRQASKIFWAYLKPKPIITDKVNAVLDGIPNRKFNLSVHYRGTDKAREAPPVNFGLFKSTIARYQEINGPLNHVFLATDESAFEKYIRQEFPGIIFHTYTLAEVDDVSLGRHFSNMTAEDKATEAIVNMLLLAEAPCLIRSTSYMSAISKIMNPASEPSRLTAPTGALKPSRKKRYWKKNTIQIPGICTLRGMVSCNWGMKVSPARLGRNDPHSCGDCTCKSTNQNFV